MIKDKGFIHPADPDFSCRLRYSQLSSELQQNGLNLAKIEESRTVFTEEAGEHYWVKPEAYRPTGVALGCPLPDEDMTTLLWTVAYLAEQFMCAQAHSRPLFAFVPREWYHVTVVNRSHFDCDRNIIGLDNGEFEKAKEIVHHGLGPIGIRFTGLILTADGRLIVPGYPTDGRFYALRRELSTRIQPLSRNLPLTAHIKIGHVTWPLDKELIKVFVDELTRYGEGISASLLFRSAYTPAGNIPLDDDTVK